MIEPGTLVVIAKTPAPHRSKTRLTPPLTPEQASEVAWACLLDTLDVVARTDAAQRVVLLDGEPGPWVPGGFAVVAQQGGGLGERLAHGFDSVGRPAVVIAMDTPQVTPEQLQGAWAALGRADVVLGPATDGGYWLVGLRSGVDATAVFAGVPMSTPHTMAAQRERCRQLGLDVVELDVLRDVDTADDVVAVASLVRDSRLAAVAARHLAQARH